MTCDDAADHSSENDPDFCYECQRDLDDCECDLDGPDDRDHEREGCVLECLHHDPFHTSAECFDVEMAKAPEDTLTDLLAHRRALVADLRTCGSDRLTRATIEAQIKMLDYRLAEARDRRVP